PAAPRNRDAGRVRADGDVVGMLGLPLVVDGRHRAAEPVVTIAVGEHPARAGTAGAAALRTTRIGAPPNTEHQTDKTDRPAASLSLPGCRSQLMSRRRPPE